MFKSDKPANECPQCGRLLGIKRVIDSWWKYIYCDDCNITEYLYDDAKMMQWDMLEQLEDFKIPNDLVDKFYLEDLQ